MPTATTPCPKCGAAIRVHGDRGACKTCGQGVRFVDAPEVACRTCAAPVPMPPGQHAAQCAKCGAWTADEPDRLVQGQATCPRCRRAIPVSLEAEQATCPHCRSLLSLQDTL
ncbi:MAG: hypothetical protein AABY18_00280 [Candidatus Thermoplasmatota archaeon]